MKILKWKTKEQGRQWVSGFLNQLGRPCVVLLSGPLGAGKTQMVKWFLEEMQTPGAVSPTFAIHQEYKTPTGMVGHMDLYRLKSDGDLESSGFWDLLSDDKALLFVEWAERLPESVWPKSWQRVFISLKITGDESREIGIRVVEAAKT